MAGNVGAGGAAAVNALSPIGLLDSGAGGISVLKEAVRQMPNERYVFYGDQKNAPYGTKTKEEVLSCVRAAVARLLTYDIKALVLACNTATARAAAELRAELSLPVIGMEPALKPASALYHGGRILVMATPGTLASEKYSLLSSRWGEHAVSVPCPGLMEYVEAGDFDAPDLQTYLERLFAPWHGTQVDAVVLGCTHYVFLKSRVQRFFPSVPILDGNEGTVRQLHRVLESRDLLSPADSEGSVLIESSGGGRHLQVLNGLYRSPL